MKGSADKWGMRALPSLLVVGTIAVGLASCSQPSGGEGAARQTPLVQGPQMERSRFISATVTRRFDAQGRMTNDRMVVKDAEELARLESYFKEAGRGERGPLTGGWVPSMVVTFKPKMGREVKVHTNYEVWSEGTGDWPVNVGLKDHMERLFARNATASVVGQ